MAAAASLGCEFDHTNGSKAALQACMPTTTHLAQLILERHALDDGLDFVNPSRVHTLQVNRSIAFSFHTIPARQHTLHTCADNNSDAASALAVSEPLYFQS
jgi:hypothetical protein